MARCVAQSLLDRSLTHYVSERFANIRLPSLRDSGGDGPSSDDRRKLASAAFYGLASLLLTEGPEAGTALAAAILDSPAADKVPGERAAVGRSLTYVADAILHEHALLTSALEREAVAAEATASTARRRLAAGLAARPPTAANEAAAVPAGPSPAV